MFILFGSHHIVIWLLSRLVTSVIVCNICNHYRRSLSLYLHVIKYAANEWQNWLLYLAVPIMQGFLPQNEFRTLEKLVQGITLLIGGEFSTDDLERARQILVEFGMEYRQHYGKNNVVMNIHMVSHHLSTSCSRFGPMWGFWCYPYENMLGYTKKFIHGTRGPEKSFVFGSQCVRTLPVLEQAEINNMQDKRNPRIVEVSIIC